MHILVLFYRQTAGTLEGGSNGYIMKSFIIFKMLPIRLCNIHLLICTCIIHIEYLLKESAAFVVVFIKFLEKNEKLHTSNFLLCFEKLTLEFVSTTLLLLLLDFISVLADVFIYVTTICSCSGEGSLLWPVKCAEGVNSLMKDFYFNLHSWTILL